MAKRLGISQFVTADAGSFHSVEQSTAALTWPCGTPKSQQNAFTAHQTEPRSSFKYTPKGSFKRQQGARFGDLELSAITLNN